MAASRVVVAIDPRERDAARVRAATRGTRAEGAEPTAHSGQRTPTAAEVMHWVQMGRSQLEQERRVSRSAWR
jgi:hypothetical protein